MEMFEGSSNWIMALGKTLIHSLWIGILFLSLLKIAYAFIAPRFASQRYRFASVVLLLFTATMVSMFSFLYVPAPEASGTATQGLNLVTPVFQDLQKDNGWQKMICYFSTYLYLTGVVAYILYTIKSVGTIHSIRKRGLPVKGAWLHRFNELKERAGTGMHALLLVSDRTRTPFLAGIVKPAIIVPAGMLTQLPFSQVESILMHELFHLKRLDHLVNLFQRIIEILFFYNPAVWSISSTIRKEREHCCDDLVLRECSQPLDYARALYQLAMDQGNLTAMVPAASGNSRGQLKNRIQRILNPGTMKTNIREKLSAILLLVGGFLIVAVISGFSSAFSVTQFNHIPDESSQPALIPDHSPSIQFQRSLLPEPIVQPEPSPLPNPMMLPDTLPAPDVSSTENEAVDWEKIQREIEEAMGEIDWDQIKKDVEMARQKVMEEIDWEEMKEEIEEARKTAMEEIDWEEIKEEIEEARRTAMEEIDWDQIKEEIEIARIHIDSVMQDFDIDLDFDMDGFKLEMEKMKKEIENSENLDF